MEIHKVAVVGAGAMGSGIATALSLAGYPVLLKDINPDTVAAGMGRIQKSLQSRVLKGTLSPEGAEHALERITPVDHYHWFENIDLVIEAAAEDIAVKHRLFRELDEVTPPHALLATNTSSLSITYIASVTKRPSQVLGLHFFNPAHVMKLVEVVRGLDTSEATLELAGEVCRRMGKLSIQVEECASFLVNRLLGRYASEALFMLQDQVIDPEGLDRAAFDFVMPMGPIALRDFTGIDIGHHVATFNHSEYGARFEPPALLGQMFERGWLGQKAGQGFYVYDPETRRPTGVNPQLAGLLERFPRSSEPFDVRRLFLPMINEALLVIQEHVARPGEIDLAMRAGLGMRRGPLQIAEDIGLAECLNLLEGYFLTHGERFRPAPLLKRLVWGRRTMVMG